MNSKLFIGCVTIALSCAFPLLAQERFDSAEAAAQALIEAANGHDSARLIAIIGPQSRAILTSGDAEKDKAEQSEFSHLAQTKHRLESSQVDQNRMILSIGDEDWPFPVPIVRRGDKWSFDASQAPLEMRARHVGANELDAIEICHGYVEAQMEYATEDRDKYGTLAYASRMTSRPGRHDGLYWEGGSDALIPEGLARATWDGNQKGQAKPYHGYYFRILDGQGVNAAGGAHNYFIKEKLIGGFGLVAWPADYGVSGIHTFMVNQEGVVYEKDIAPVAGKPGVQITRFDPDRSWNPVE